MTVHFGCQLGGAALPVTESNHLAVAAKGFCRCDSNLQSLSCKGENPRCSGRVRLNPLKVFKSKADSPLKKEKSCQYILSIPTHAPEFQPAFPCGLLYGFWTCLASPQTAGPNSLQNICKKLSLVE